MHVKEVTQIIFSELVSDPYIKSQRDYVIEQGWSRPERYSAELVVAGRVEDDVYVRHGVLQPYTYLSVHSSLQAAMLADTSFDGAFSLMAGRRSNGSWAYGRGDIGSETIWMNSQGFDESGLEGLIKFRALSRVAGRIASRAIEMIDAGMFDMATYGSLDLEL